MADAFLEVGRALLPGLPPPAAALPPQGPEEALQKTIPTRIMLLLPQARLCFQLPLLKTHTRSEKTL